MKKKGKERERRRRQKKDEKGEERKRKEEEDGGEIRNPRVLLIYCSRLLNIHRQSLLPYLTSITTGHFTQFWSLKTREKTFPNYYIPSVDLQISRA